MHMSEQMIGTALKCLRKLALAGAGLILTPWAEARAEAGPPQPRLIIAISVDQLSSNLFEQYRDRFTGGMKRLAQQGVVFPNGYQSHAATETCPGHSTILTGRHPAATGIIANVWYDRETGRDNYCVHDPDHPVPGRENQPRGPGNLKVSTLGEWMKAANPKSRVFGVSGKDRAAIMMTGRNPDGVFWWDDENGFTTSVPAGTTAAARLAPVAGFNKALFDGWLKTPPGWQMMDRRCAALQSVGHYADLTIDHRVPPPGGELTPGENARGNPVFRKWFRASPGLDALTLDLAGSLIERYRLGSGEAPDLLAISLSATDYVGHRYGNQGPEMCDQLAHLDQMLGSFLAKVEALKLPVAIVLTADHGAVDAAERVAERGIPAVRFDRNRMLGEVTAQVKAELGLDFNPLAGDGDQLYIVTWQEDPALRRRIRDLTIALLKKRPEVAEAFSADDVAGRFPPRGKPADELSMIERIAESFDRERSGDIVIAFQPNMSFGHPETPGDTVAGHGSPWNHDRRVPILFWWPGTKAFEQSLPVETIDIAPTLATLLGLKTPEVDGRCLDLDPDRGDMCAMSAR